MPESFTPRQALQRARHDPQPLDANDWRGVIGAFTNGAFTDAQMAAWLMARVLHGISVDEAVALTDAMLHSGTQLTHKDSAAPVVDKHSTGGVADTTTLIVAPLVASVGLVMAKLSGGSLGHTGGTLDKLAAIPGFRTALNADTFLAQTRQIGVAIAAATRELVPADRLLYALRDHIELVDDTALIAASIMSKKLATGATHLVLDVKLGQASILGDDSKTRALAQLCVAIGKAHGRHVTAVLSDMNQPLGPAIGNALEVRAAIDVLAGRTFGRLGELSLKLAAELLHQTGVPFDTAYQQVSDALHSGAAIDRFAQLVAAQGGDATVVADPTAVLGLGEPVAVWAPSQAGTVTAIDTRRLGVLARELAGADMNLRAGLTTNLTLGMASDTVVVALYTDNPAQVAHATAVLDAAVEIADGPVQEPPLIQTVIR
jgi:pyrimidine-nucleoside phosphorylase